MTSNIDRDMLNKPMRADFISEVVGFDEVSHIASMRMLPDPRRYDEIEHDGQKLYLDKYLGHAFPLEAMTENFAGTPLYELSPRIDSTPEYADARQSALEAEMVSGEYTPPSQQPLEHQELNLFGSTRQLGFLSVDICSSSALRRQNPAEFDRSYELFTRELGTLVGQFHGTILKTKGDGFIAFIDHPSFTRLCDNLVDMGISLLVLLHQSLNPVLLKAGMTPLSIRIGADYGEALVKTITIPTTGFASQEVASDALNRAVKIEEACEPDQFWIGRCLYELIHVQWLERATVTECDGEALGMPGYQTYRIY